MIMENMGNFYNLLDVPYSASNKQIIMGYQNKISKYVNLKNISSEQIKEIKTLKTAIYILTNEKLKEAYDNLLHNENPININPININPININTKNNISIHNDDSTDFLTNSPVAGNHMGDDNLDAVFNVDNSWMKQETSNINNKKAGIDINLLGNRVFSLPNYAKKQNYSSDIDSELRKPKQCRDDKSKMNEENSLN